MFPEEEEDAKGEGEGGCQYDEAKKKKRQRVGYRMKGGRRLAFMLRNFILAQPTGWNKMWIELAFVESQDGRVIIEKYRLEEERFLVPPTITKHITYNIEHITWRLLFS